MNLPRRCGRSRSGAACLPAARNPRTPALRYPSPGRQADAGLSLADAVAADIDAVEELPDILVLHETGLANQSRRAGGELEVGALHNKLVLDRVALGDCDPLEHVHRAHELLAQEVAELQSLPTVGDRRVDREVRVDEAHVVLELLLHAVEEVVDV